MIVAAINWHTFFFLMFALLACGFALATLLSRNIVRMAFSLMLCLGATSGIFFLAGAEFVGAMQLMIYVGGTMVLLVFGVMLTAQEALLTMRTRSGDWVLGMIVGGALLVLLVQTALSVAQWRHPAVEQAQAPVAATKTATPLGMGLLGVRVDKAQQDDAVLRRGMAGYLLPFEIVSVHLVVVLIGAAYLARARRRTSRQAERRALS